MNENGDDLFERAVRALPGGVDSPVRAFGAVGGDPVWIESAKGPWLNARDGTRYLDLVGSWGPMILGHAHRRVVEALRDATGRSTSFGMPSALEVELAETVIEMVPSVEMVRFVNSGTEATMSALRLARAATGRDRVIKFAGGYHGHADAFLVAAGSGAVTHGVPSSPGVPEGAARDTLTAVYNDAGDVRRLFEENAGEVAAVIVEPVAGNMGVVPPEDGFLPSLRTLCDEHGALLIFDEVMTGFRVARGGAQEFYDVRPDLTTLGKIVGGGLPVGVYGGRRDLMERIAPSGPVYQAGTLSGNPLAMTAGLETLRLLKETPATWARLEDLGSRVQEGLESLGAKHPGRTCVQRVGSMLTLFFQGGPVRNFDDAKAQDHEAFGRFFHGMLRRGVHLPPSSYEAWFLSATHGDEEIDLVLSAAAEALPEALEASA
ncbi:MAG: glutamate-1-semialdehyde 2,1-aminomutase [Planctomycetota bacterium]|jgi:glutamate-1-semialdehyde 2,1-aminomutase